MFKILIGPKLTSLSARTFASAAVKPVGSLPASFGVSEEGFQLACLPYPACWNGMARVALVFSAGSRSELDSKDRGITHLLRRACGISTSNFTSVNLTRHFQQMGARVQCATTREHMICTVDVAPNFVTRAGYLLTNMVTRPLFYSWELKNTVNRLMLKDIDILNRRNQGALAVELLHEAAFGTHSSGCGLGHSLFASADRVGSYTIEQIENFLKHHFTPKNTTLAVVGCGLDVDNEAILRQIKFGIHVNPAQVISKSANVPEHGFVGGEIRRDQLAAATLHVLLAWPIAGSVTDPQETLAYELAVRCLNGVLGRVQFSPEAGDSCLAKTAVKTGPASTTCVRAFSDLYSDHGLFGVAVAGNEGASVFERLQRVIEALRSAQITAEQLENAKTQMKLDLCFEEEGLKLASNVALQLATTGKPYEGAAVRCPLIDKVDIVAVSQAIKKACSSTKAALSVVGKETDKIPPLSILLKNL